MVADMEDDCLPAWVTGERMYEELMKQAVRIQEKELSEQKSWGEELRDP